MKGNVGLSLLYGFFASLLFFLSSESVIAAKRKTVCKSKECKATAKILKKSMDTKVNPCDDFYRYACGNWPKNYGNKFQWTERMTMIELRAKQNDEEILKFLLQKNNKDEPESVHKMRKLYSMCLNPESYDGIDQLLAILSNIGLPIVPFSTNENSNFDYVSALAKATKIAGIMMYFSVLADINPYNHNVNDIVLSQPTYELDPFEMLLFEDKKTVKREQFFGEAGFMEKVIKKICAHVSSPSCGEGNFNLKANVLKLAMDQKEVMKEARFKPNSSLVPTIHTLEELQNISDNIANYVKPSIPKFNWTRYIEETFGGVENVHLDLRNASNVRIVVREINYIQDMIKFMYKKNIKEIEFGLWWKIVSVLLPYADFDIAQARNDINFHISLEKVCKQITINVFDMAMSYVYLKKERYNIAKIQIEDMLKHIRKNFQKILKQSSWMDEKTKEEAVIKLELMKSLIAYPDPKELPTILDEIYGNIKLTGSFLGTMIAMAQKEIADNLKTLNEIHNPTRTTIENWDMPIFTVNAGYIDAKNVMIIPAGILGPPVYTNSLKAFDYGSIGSVVGHELTHGFDQSGRQYNKEGVIKDWWNDETLEKYKEKSRCFLKAYDKYNSTFQNTFQKINSIQTLDEDMSDNVGFKAALFAYRTYVSENGEEPSLRNFEEFTSEQLFTLGFASFWCERPTDYSSYLVRYMTHSPNGVRVNGIFKNSHEFSGIWNCPEGTNMNPSGEKCSLW